MEKMIGPSGSECYRLFHDSGSKVILARQGGHLISWKTADGIERLYLSPQADFSPGQAIRGGVPVIFPQFSDYGPFGRHGFARKTEWMPDLELGAMRLDTTELTLAQWPHPFELTLRPVLSASALEIELTVTNPGLAPVSFQAALHTYQQIHHFDTAKVTGLEGMSYRDDVTGKTVTAGDAPLVPGAVIDRAYFGSGSHSILLQDGSSRIVVESESFEDVVIWNPGPGHGIGDLPADGWRHFLCIESAQIQSPATLAPGQSWRGVQRLEVTSLSSI